MSAYTAGIDVGSTYTKAVVLGPDRVIAGRAMRPTGFQLARVAEDVLAAAALEAGIAVSDVAYTVATFFPDFSRPWTSEALWTLPALTFVVYLGLQWWAFW